MSVATGDLFDGLGSADKAMREAVMFGMGRGGLMLEHDVVQEEPTTPRKEGDLRGSGSVHVQGKFLQASPPLGSDPTPNTDNIDPPVGDIIEATVGFNKPYAAVQHEGGWETGPLAGVKIVNYTEPSSGPKFLESKMAARGERYIEEAANSARRRMGS